MNPRPPSLRHRVGEGVRRTGAGHNLSLSLTDVFGNLDTWVVNGYMQSVWLPV